MALLTWLFTRKPDPLLATLNILIDQQQQTQLAMLKTVQAMSEASAKQAEVLGGYLKLFQTPGDPVGWKEDFEEQNKEQLIRAGFPAESDEADQAKWVLEHLDRL
jgi:hypothetical protein